MGQETTRREFLKQMALAGAALTVLPGVADAAEAASNGKSRVVMTTDAAAMSAEGQVNKAVLGKMLGKSMAKLTGTDSGAKAWKKLFTPQDVVGIKINCLFGKGVSTRPEFVDVVIEGLKMAGVKEDNIIVWDRSASDLIKCGYTPNKDGKGVKYFSDDGHWGPEIEIGAFKGRISTIINDKVTAIINMPILKSHGMTGVTCCLKNHYGSFDNPGRHHGNNCNPAMADFNSLPVIKEKTRLVVIDALRPQHSGGPGLQDKHQFNYYGLMVATDPLAADYHGVEIIKKKLAEVGRAPLSDGQLAWLQAAQERGVGTCDPAKIELLRV